MSLKILPYSKEYIVVFASRDDGGLQSTIANKISNSVSSKRERPLCKAVIPPKATNAEWLKLSERSVNRNFVLDDALGLKAENKNAPKPFTHLGILYKSVNRIGSVHTAGFVIVKAVKMDFYVNVICAEQHDKSKNSPRFGSLLMQKTIEYARTHGFMTMSLSALDHVKDFYVRFNFKAGDGDPCSREWKAKRIKARSAGYRFRKCLVGAEEANFVPASQVRNSYRLPAKSQGRATTELTTAIQLSPDNGAVTSRPSAVANAVRAEANRRAQASANRRAAANVEVINLVSSNDENAVPSAANAARAAAQRRAAEIRRAAAASRQAAARMAVVQAAMFMAARPMFMAARPPTRPTGRPSTLAAADYAAINDLFAAHPELK